MTEGGYSEGVPYRVERSHPHNGGSDQFPWAVVDTVDDTPIALCVTRHGADDICTLLNNESN